MGDLTGWKHAATDAPDVITRLQELRQRVPFELREIIILGMGGSALAAYVLKTLFSNEPQQCVGVAKRPEKAPVEPSQRSKGELGEPPDAAACAPLAEPENGSCPDMKIRVVDTTDPAYVKRVLDEMDTAGLLLIVASKSGTTLEPNVLYRAFQQRLTEGLGSAALAARHCVAVTDPGTTLEALAREEDWLAVVSTPVDIGGRYSALTAFGLASLVLAGADVGPLIKCAQEAEARAWEREREREQTQTQTRAEDADLADFLTSSAEAGRDVLLLVLAPRFVAVGRWLEQLIAESLGKDGRGLIPIVTTPERAEKLLLFSPRAQAVVSVALIGEEACDDAAALTRLRETARTLGVPAFDYPFCEPADLGALFVDWEFAVAACGERLGVNPFDQPDVAASKEATSRILQERGPERQHEDLPVHSLTELAAIAGGPDAHYLALLAWMPYSKVNDELLQRQARELERQHGLPVAICYGPRYLHSTGQGYKGGPPTGLFLFTGDNEEGADVLVPSYGFTLAQLCAAERQGDIEALCAKGRLVFIT
ncbi:MAG: hypothetical protein FWD65_07635 [Coriobacteriia bacterium]|nr:hypothetical protein [Coriobacteriia bacterium]